MRSALAVGSLMVLCVAAVPCRAQAPIGDEIDVGPGSAVQPHVAGQPSGFVTVRNGVPGLAGHLIAADGTRLGSDFVVTASSGDAARGRPAVDTAADGSFVVVWSRALSGYGPEVFARRFTAGGAPLGSEIHVNVATTGAQILPSVAVAPGGDFVVAWEGAYPSDVFARRFDAAGSPLGSEFLLNTTTASTQAEASVYGAPDGGFVALWISIQQGGPAAFDVVGRRFDAAGQPLTPEFIVNTFSGGTQYAPAAAFAADGSFLVVWTGEGPTDGQGIFAQRYDAAGARVGAEFRVNRTAADEQLRPDVSAETGGRFLVVWSGQHQDLGRPGVFAQLLDPQGRLLAGEFRVNTYGPGYHSLPAVASDGHGRLLVVWETAGDARGQALGGMRPVALAVDAAGNGVAEPGEIASLAPTWLNTTGAAVSATGAIPRFVGPTGGSHSIIDNAADYGTLADGAQASCGANCFAVRASATTRPLTHWDASATEEMNTGHRALYAVHVGESFSDVPRTNPFYRYVETLLHRGVTSGCSATTYCPSAATTRDQMAVFVLVGKDGSGFTPRECTTPVFADVPAASPYCRWVEELARRGAVSGCGGGNYCPGDPVTREQMAVFVLRALDPDLVPPGCTTPVFNDVPAGSPYCRWIEELARRGIAGGCGGGSYCPSAAVTRDQMGVFIGGTFGLTLYGP